MAEILWSRPICKVAGDYLAWPTVAACASGEVLVVFSGDREEHVCPYGKTLLIRSGDRGETWTEPVSHPSSTTRRSTTVTRASSSRPRVRW